MGLPAGITMRVAELAAVAPGRIELRIQRKLKSPNEVLGRHWREKNRERKEWQRHIANAIVLSVGTAGAKAILGPGADLVGCRGVCADRRRVEVIRFAPRPRNFIKDDDNLRFAVKPLLDALKRLALIKDDRREWIDLPTPTQDVSNDLTFWTWIAVIDMAVEAHATNVREPYERAR